MADYPPDLFAIPDTPQETYWVKQCLRWLAERNDSLRASFDSLTDPAQVSLTSLDTRLGVLERKFAQLDDSGTPFTLAATVGTWRQTVSAAGVGSYVWDTEDVNQGGYTRAALNTQIVVPSAGFYLIAADLGINNIAGPNSECVVRVNGTNVGRDWVTAVGNFGMGHITHVASLSGSDVIDCRNTSDDRYGDANRYTRLAVYKLAES